MSGLKHSAPETLRYMLSLVGGDPIRNVYIREIASGDQEAFADYHWCIELGWIEEVSRRTVAFGQEEREYRLTKKGYDYAKGHGLHPNGVGTATQPPAAPEGD